MASARLWVIGCWLLGSARVAAAAPLATITVEAGEVARERSPVAFPWNKGPIVLQDEKGRRVAAQVDGGEARFVLPALGRGQRARFELVAPPAAAPVHRVTVARGAEALELRVDGAPVFHYRTHAPAPTAEIPANFLRAGYLHPIFSPKGVIVTDDSPADHRHHHGVWTAWTAVEHAGRRLSFWGPEPGKSKNDLVGVDALFGGPLAAGFTARLQSSDLGVTPARPVLDSTWKVVAYRTHEARAPYRLFDLTWTDAVVGKDPVRVLEHRYGGLGVRAQRAWLDPLAVTFLTSEGHDRLAGEGTRARWVYVGGAVAGARAGLALLVHPLNQRAPEPVRLNPGIPLLCVSPAKAGPLLIEPGRPYEAKYRFVVTDGPPDAKLLERLWRDYARPVKVTVEAAATTAAAARD